MNAALLMRQSEPVLNHAEWWCAALCEQTERPQRDGFRRGDCQQVCFQLVDFRSVDFLRDDFLQADFRQVDCQQVDL